jgi:L-asparagine oxygenase
VEQNVRDMRGSRYAASTTPAVGLGPIAGHGFGPGRARTHTILDSAGCSWTIREPEGAVFELDPLLAADMHRAAEEIAAECAHKDAIDDHELLVRTEVALRCVSPELMSQLVSFRLGGVRDGMLLIRGLPVDDPLPETPPTGAFEGSWRDLPVSTLAQLMVMGVLGGLIAYADEKDGRLIQDICPVPGAETRQENTGSCLLELHTEDGFHPNMPHFISLLALRSDHERQALTVAGGARAVLPKLSAEHFEALCAPEYRIRLASSFVGTDRRVYSPAMPVFSGSKSDPDMCVDFHATEPLTERAGEALEALRGHMLSSLVGAVLERGDMVIVDNRKAVHGRTAFMPRYDGQDRWLRRCFTVADIRSSQSLLLPGSRVHRPLTEELLAA